jgi:PilZ domain
MGPNSQGLTVEACNPDVVGVPDAASNQNIELRRVECFLTESLFRRILRRMFPDQRKHERFPVPPLVGYLGTANSSEPYPLGDISMTGFCLLTDERWLPGTEMPITLHSKNLPAGNERDSFTVQATVVRCGQGGVAFSIVLSEENSQAAYGNPLRVQWVTRTEMESYLKRLKEQPGSEKPQIIKTIPKESAAGSGARAGFKAAFESGRQRQG